MLIEKTEIPKLVELVNQGKAIFIPTNVASKKNGKEIRQRYTNKSECCNVASIKQSNKWFCTKCRKPTKLRVIRFVGSSDKVLEYEKETEEDYLKNKALFKRLTKGLIPPYYIGWFFIRKSKHKFDYSNLIELPQDLMTKYGYWDDDNCDFNVPIVLGHAYNKEQAGVIMVVFKDKPKIDLEKLY